jgi:hypothetical protein
MLKFLLEEEDDEDNDAGKLIEDPVLRMASECSFCRLIEDVLVVSNLCLFACCVVESAE